MQIILPLNYLNQRTDKSCWSPWSRETQLLSDSAALRLTAQGHRLIGAAWFSGLKCRAGGLQISSFAKEDGVSRCISQANMKLYLWIYSLGYVAKGYQLCVRWASEGSAVNWRKSLKFPAWSFSLSGYNNSCHGTTNIKKSFVDLQARTARVIFIITHTRMYQNT